MVVAMFVFITFLISFIFCVNPNNGSLLEALHQEKPPEFVNTKRMNAQIVKPMGNMGYFKCKSTGYPTPNITWTKNFKEPNRQFGKVKYGTWSLTLEDLTSDDSGTYTCKVCNKLGCISHNFTLDVVERYHVRPILIDYQQNQTVTYGSNVTFSCRFLSDMQAVIYWVAGTYVKNDSPSNIKTIIDSQNPKLLELNNVTYVDEGWYTCIAANSLGKTSVSSYLTVVEDLKHTNVDENEVDLKNGSDPTTTDKTIVTDFLDMLCKDCFPGI